MSIVKKEIKYLKEKQKNLHFFTTYLNVSKLRLVKELNNEQETLNILRKVRNSNYKLLDSVNKNFFKKENLISIESASTHLDSRKTRMFLLIDAKNGDEFADVMYKKMEENLREILNENDYIVTVGSKVNIIAQKLEANIISHFPYELYDDYNNFIEKISSIVEIGFKNNTFDEAIMMIAQQNQDDKKLVQKKLAPFERNLQEEMQTLSSTASIDEENKILNEFQQRAIIDYPSVLDNLNVKKITWYPNIEFFKYRFIKSIIKQNIFELKLIEKIQRIKLELQLIDEKKNKINEELIVLTRLINRVRKEKSTESTIILHSAFKLKLSGNEEDEIFRKKREEDDSIFLKKYKGGK